MDFTINLKAGQWTRQETAGRMFLLTDAGVAGTVEVRLEMPGQNDETVGAAGKGFKATLQVGMFSSVAMRAAVDTVAKCVISENLIDYDFTEGATVSIANNGTPIQVSNDRGTPGNLLFVSGVSLADAPATAATNGATVACGPAAAVVAVADANRRALRLLNLGPDPVAIGAAGLTWATRTIVLDVGDVWIEDRGANLAWSAITDAGKAASVTAQAVTA